MANDTPPSDEVDPRRVRLGLAFLVIVVVGGLIGAAVVHNSTGRVVLLGIVGFTVIRVFVLTRSLRRR